MAKSEFSGPKLRAARKVAGMTLEELSSIAGRAPITIRGYEVGRFEIPLVVARAFAAVLHIDVNDLKADPPKRRGRRAS